MARSVWKGPFVEGSLIKKAEKARQTVRSEVIKTWSRRSTILPQFVDPEQPLAAQVAILAASSFVIEFCVLASYSALAARAGERVAPRFQRIAERLGGAMLVAAGAGLAAT